MLQHSLDIIILAAGRGKRMCSGLPKVLHKVAGKTMLEHTFETSRNLRPNNVFVVYGNGGSDVRQAMRSLDVNWVEQEELLGTGHAVQQVLPKIVSDQVLIVYADVPLVSEQTLTRLLMQTPEGGVGILTTKLDDPTGFGRIVRDSGENIMAIVEDKDASDAERQIFEINTGIITTSAENLREWLPKLNNKNMQNEFYLTDIVSMALESQRGIVGVAAESSKEVQGVNDRWQLAMVEGYFRERMAKYLANSGVTLIDSSRFDMRCREFTIAQDVVFDVNVILEGKINIAKECYIGPNCYLRDVVLEEGVTIKANSVIEGAHVQPGAVVGPFARIRPGTTIEKNAKVGNFVEIKNSVLGESSKASHLSYLGDTTIGRDVNIGAGTITCNYDGVSKHKTHIEDGAFIGSNVSLVAPLNIGSYACVGAGSTITENVPKNSLALSRVKQRIIESWKKGFQKKKNSSLIDE